MFTGVGCGLVERARATILAIDVVVGCVVSIQFLDLRLAQYVVASRDAVTEFASKIVPDMGSPSVLLTLVVPFAAIVFVKSEGIRANRTLLILGTIATAHAICAALKFLFGRARPDLFFDNGIYSFDFWHVDYAFHSFPSGHAAICAGLAMVAGRLVPARRLALLTTGFAFAFVPVVTGVHYLSDAMLGFGIGVAATAIFEALLMRLQLPIHEAV